MSRLFRATYLLLMLVFITLIAPVTQAQSPDVDIAITHISATPLDDGEVRVSAIVSVLDADGLPVGGLRGQDFTLQENSTSVESQNLNVTTATAPLTLILLVDTSRSMGNPGPTGVLALDSAKDAAAAFIENLGQDDQVAVYEYNAQMRRQQDFTFDHNLAIDQGVAALQATDAAPACLYDALSTVSENLSNQPPGRRLILVLTGNPDSTTADTCSGATADDVIETATVVGNSMPIYIVGFGRQLDQDELARLSGRTGGQSLIGQDSTTLADLMTRVTNLLKGQYEINYATQASSGLATIRITENSSQKSANRQVFIPAAIQPTPTPLPQFSIDLDVDQTNAGQLKVNVTVPAEVVLEQTELFVDNRSLEKAVSPPFDQFNLDILKLGSGQHKIRVEATDQNQVTAIAEVEVDLQILPTPVPTATSTPSPTPTPEATGRLGSVPVLPVLLILVGLIILLALIGLIGYLLFFYAKQPTVTLPAPSAPPPVNPMITIDDEPAAAPWRPANNREVTARRARLVVVAGHEALEQPEFSVQKAEIRLGRNTAKEAYNDIPVQDKEASRSHAKIMYRDQNFFIQDLNSASGTFVNRVKIKPTQEMLLQNGTEIMIGPNVKFRFELVIPQDIDQTLADFASRDELRTQDDYEDPDQTLYSKMK